MKKKGWKDERADKQHISSAHQMEEACEVCLLRNTRINPNSQMGKSKRLEPFANHEPFTTREPFAPFESVDNQREI